MENENASNGRISSSNVLEEIPKTTLQQIYNAITGKTENMRRVFAGNVKILSSDIDNLHQKISDQLAIHENVVKPVVSVDVKDARGQSITYSSWERYKSLGLTEGEVTSEFTLNYELLIRLPNTTGPQKCIINILLDSALPVINDHQKRLAESDVAGIVLLMRRQWQTVFVTIEFVDFLIARSFMGIVSEWFDGLDKSRELKYNEILFKCRETLLRATSQSARIGFAFYLIFCAYFSNGTIYTFGDAFYIVAVGLFLWSLVYIVETAVGRVAMRHVISNTVPSVIILTNKDQQKYDASLKKQRSPIAIFLKVAASLIGGVAVNLASSYLVSNFFATP